MGHGTFKCTGWGYNSDADARQRRATGDKKERKGREALRLSHVRTFVTNAQKYPRGLRSGYFLSLIVLGSSKSVNVLDLGPRNIRRPAPTSTFRPTS